MNGSYLNILTKGCSNLNLAVKLGIQAFRVFNVYPSREKNLPPCVYYIDGKGFFKKRTILCLIHQPIHKDQERKLCKRKTNGIYASKIVVENSKRLVIN